MTLSTLSKSLTYPIATITRADQAWRCSPFQIPLFGAMVSNSIPLQNIAGDAGVKAKYTLKAISEARAESNLLWLIKVGILRREVDGQGITDSFRLTPLGRILLDRWQGQIIPKPSLWEKIINSLNRWLSLPL
ncbi:MAG: hypothetical protein N5P05_000064 [Chroococcopsis gigantea SAG 12.99]|jgi:hypothetical protein|nr:hypothetical protein [Chlorogloea purpurea SAG 13.99]MDV2998458.1 hypothetical protein [Chroococcopsis gigantea SAG 12.99]